MLISDAGIAGPGPGVEEGRWILVENKEWLIKRCDPKCLELTAIGRLYILMKHKPYDRHFADIVGLMSSVRNNHDLATRLYGKFVVAYSDVFVDVLMDLGAFNVLWHIILYATQEAITSAEYVIIALLRRVTWERAKTMVESPLMNYVLLIVTSAGFSLQTTDIDFLNNCVDEYGVWSPGALAQFVMSQMALKLCKN